MTLEQVKIVRQWMKLIYEVVDETDKEGGICPEGVMYAALQGSMSLDQFQQMLAAGKNVGIFLDGPASHTILPGRVAAEKLGVAGW